MKHRKPEYIRLKKLSIEEAFDLIRQEQRTTIIDEQIVSTDSLRLRTFLNSLQCVTCHRAGSFFAIERHNANSKIIRWHINLWAVNEYGHETLMTHDHIVARSLGGPDGIENTQTMCSPCNSRKSKWERRYLDERRKFPFLLF